MEAGPEAVEWDATIALSIAASLSKIACGSLVVAADAGGPS